MEWRRATGRNSAKRAELIGYLGHDPELFNDTVEQNILMGDQKDARTYLKAVCFDEEVEAMEQGTETFVGSGGVRLSGGQASVWRWRELYAIKRSC